jgi:O-antigen/teichoic acid export membrane protein
MASSLDKSDDSRTTESDNSVQAIQPTPFLDGSSQCWHYDQTALNDFPTLPLSTVSIESVYSEINGQLIAHSPLPAHFVVDQFTVCEQPTWIIPVLRDAPRPPENVTGGSGYVSLIRNLVKSSGIYALASLAAPLVSLILAPFLTHRLSHSDYGVLAILTTAISLVAGITQLGVNSAFLRTYNYDYETQHDRMAVLSTTVTILLLVSLPVTFVELLTAPWLSVILLNSSSFSGPIQLAAFIILLQNLTVPGFSWLRAEKRAGLSSLLSMLSLVITAALTIFLVGEIGMGITGALIATASGYAVIVIATLPVIVRLAGIRLRFDITWVLLAFGLPNVLNFVSGWVLQLSDRYLLGHLGSLSQTASYTVAYSLGGVLSSVVITPFSLAWWAVVYTIAKREDAPRIFMLVFRWFSFVLLFSTFGLSLFGVGLLYAFFPEAYHSAALIIPIIALSSLFNGLYVVVSAGISVQGKTWFLVIFTTISALLNVGLNLILIPVNGAMGAALSTLLAYAVFTLMAYVINQRIYPVPFEVGLFLLALLIGMILYGGSDFIASFQQEYTAWGIRICALAIYSMVLGLLGYLTSKKSTAISERRPL